jgi:hypothetical protein
MTTKDYIYLGLILLTALAFYCHGFYAGVHRCKRMYDTPADDTADEETTTATASGTTSDDKLLGDDEKDVFCSIGSRIQKPLSPKTGWRGDFGNN